MANLLASPTVSPSKSLPLQEGGGSNWLSALWFIPGHTRALAHVTNWAVSCLVLFRRSVRRHSRKLSRVVSGSMSMSMRSLYVHISRPTSRTRILRGRYNCRDTMQTGDFCFLLLLTIFFVAKIRRSYLPGRRDL